MTSKKENLTQKSKLSSAKLALLQKRLRGEIEFDTNKKIFQEKLPTIVPQPNERYQPFPLTDVQQAYWVGRSGAFELSNISTHVYFEIDTVDLDLARFEKAWQQLIERHDMLRAIVRTDGQQQILQQVPAYQIKTLDLREENIGRITSQLSQVREQLSHQVLPADRWPLFEIQAVKLENNRVRLCLSLDILIGDAWSFDIIIGELVELIQNPDLSLPPLELSFRDYVLAEFSLRDSQLYQRSKDYWLERVPTLPLSPELPLEKNLAAVEYPHFLHRTQKLDPNIWKRLKKRITEANLTHSGFLLAAFAEILTAWSKSPQFTINLTLFNRLPLHPQVNQIAGDFTSLTLLTVDNSGNDSFIERARRIQKQLWDDFDHRYFSGVQVLRELARIHKQSKGVLMPVIFTSTLINDNLSNEQNEKLSSIHKLGEVVYNISQTPQVYLDLQVNEIGGTLVVELDAVEELFPRGLLDDMFAAYCHFLESLGEEEELWYQTTRQLLPPKQLQQITSINTTEAPIPQTALLHSLFFEQVNKHPTQVAVVSNQGSLTYQELSDRAHHLGLQLRNLGTRPNELVAIVMEKGWEQVVAVLAVLASGAAYVPIDPDLPKERRLHLLQQGEVKLVLTQSKFDTNLEWSEPEGSELEQSENVTRICVDSLEIPDSVTPLQWIQQPSDLAYVIYTSGSTGLPKGVMTDHKGALNTIIDINQRFKVSSQDRVFALSSLSFDLSVYDIFGTLAAGATIVIPDPSASKDPAQWISSLGQQQVSVWNSVPALMQMLVEYVGGNQLSLPSSLRLVLLSGDWLPLSLPEKIRALCPEKVEVISLGGATEASIWSILYPIEQVDPNWKSIPYGRPMVNQHFYVLNEALQPCPVWVPGQLYIGGIGLALGYWRNEEKTCSSFFVHPQTKERLYKTGDLGRYLPDGNIEFLGREDSQVKVNGYRIELGEIETALQQHSAVKKAVVSAVGESRENKQLVAYLVPDRENPSQLFEVENISQAEVAAFWSSLVKTVGIEVEQLPSKINTQTFTSCISVLDRLSIFSICRTLKELGLFIRPGEKYSLADILQSCQIQPHYSKLLSQWFSFLEEKGLLQRLEGDIFVNPQSLPTEEPDELWEEVKTYTSQDPQIEILVNYFKRSIKNHITMLKGKVNPLELFFPGGDWQTAESLYQLNPLSEYYNTMSGKVVESIAQNWSGNGKLQVLEVGAGTGGTTAFLLPVLPKDKTIYTYTDLSQFFLKQAQEKFQDYPFVEYALLDIDQNPAYQGFVPHSFDIIFAANVLHDAREVETTLQYLRSLLVPGGLLVILETTRSTPFQMASVRFIEGFSHYEDDRLDSNQPLLSVPEWQNALNVSGFSLENFMVLPELGSKTEIDVEHVMVVQAPLQVERFQPNVLQNHLRQKLPDYMVPATYMLLNNLPLTSNGKVDRRSLPIPSYLSVKKGTSYVMPQTEAEQLIAKVWQEVLQVERIGIYDNFFDIGGDSLLLVKTQVKFQTILGRDLPLVEMIKCPTIESFAKYLSQNTNTQNAAKKGQDRAKSRKRINRTRKS